MRYTARSGRLCDGERVGGPRSGGRGTPSGCSIYGARCAPFDIIAAFRRGNFDILPCRAIRDAPAARERGKEKRLSLISSRLPRDISNDPGTGSYIESAEEEILFGTYIELRGQPRNISSALRAHNGAGNPAPPNQYSIFEYQHQWNCPVTTRYRV